MSAINDPILAQGEAWKTQLAARKSTIAVGIEPATEDDPPFSFTEEEARDFSYLQSLGLIPSAKAALDKGFHIFPLTPRDKHPLAGSQGFKDSKSPLDPSVLSPWQQNPNLNIGINLGASDLCVLDFDKPESIPAWLNETRTFKVRTAKGIHIYFRGTRKTTKLYADGNLVGDVKSAGGYTLAAGSVHPSGAVYEVVDDSAIVPLPDISSLVRHDSERVNATSDGPPIPRGSHDTELTRIAGVLRNAAFGEQEIEEHLIDVCEKRCEGYGADYRLMCKKVAHSIGKKPVGQAAPPVMMSGHVLGQTSTPVIPSGRTMQFVRGDSIKPTRLKWLWRGRILADKLNVFSGEPDVGKGMTTVDLAARITRHWDFPDCKNELDGPKDVAFLSSEDDMEDTIVPRLIVAGADMARVHFVQISENTSGTIEEGIVCLDRDLPALEEMIKQYPNTVLIIPDPVIAFLGDADPNKDKDVRPIYSKMKTFAKKLNVGWLFVNHWNKNQNATSINRTSGAKTMVSAPRATWMFTRSPEDPTRYLMMKGKGNLSSNAVKTLAYRIVGQNFDFGDGRGIEPGAVPKLVWDGETDHAAEQVLREANEPKLARNTKAEEFLTGFLAEGAKLASEVYRAGDNEGLSTDKLKRARYSLDYPAEKVAGRWYWGNSQADLTMVRVRTYVPAVSFGGKAIQPEAPEHKVHGGARARAGRKPKVRL
jgi:AAA domain/Bifunctional DNA primase/polymerase, N-terminal